MRADSHSLKPNAELTSYLAPPQQGAFRKPSKCDSKIDINGEVKGCSGHKARSFRVDGEEWGASAEYLDHMGC
jgi:hypothetical protein